MRPYGVSKGMALSLIIERLSGKDRDDSDGKEEGDSPCALSTVLETDASERLVKPRLSSSAADMAGMVEDKEKRVSSPFRWLLCMSEVMARDEDLFSTLKELAEGDETTTAITCCVGKTLSQAEFHLAPLGSQESGETAGLLDLLRTRGLWLASVRFGYLYGALARRAGAGASAPPVALHKRPAALLSDRALQGVAAVFECEWRALVSSDEAGPVEELTALEEGPTHAEHAALRLRLQLRACEALAAEAEACGLADCIRAGPCGGDIHGAIDALARVAVAAFFDNDLLEAARLLLEGAKGSFGIVLSHALDSPRELVLGARGQSMSVAFFPRLGIVSFGSEAAATKAPLTTDASHPWWRPFGNAAAQDEPTALELSSDSRSSASRAPQAEAEGGRRAGGQLAACYPRGCPLEPRWRGCALVGWCMGAPPRPPTGSLP